MAEVTAVTMTGEAIGEAEVEAAGGVIKPSLAAGGGTMTEATAADMMVAVAGAIRVEAEDLTATLAITTTTTTTITTITTSTITTTMVAITTKITTKAVAITTTRVVVEAESGVVEGAVEGDTIRAVEVVEGVVGVGILITKGGKAEVE